MNRRSTPGVNAQRRNPPPLQPSPPRNGTDAHSPDPLDLKCPVCHAHPGQPCTNLARFGEPLPGRIHHIGRKPR